MDNHTRGLFPAAWRIAKPYFTSNDKWAGWGLLAAIISLNLGQVALSVRLSYWRNTFFNTFQNFDQNGFSAQIIVFVGLAALWILIGTSRTFLNQMLRIRWRRWLTDYYIARWLDRRAYYRLQLSGTSTDNPDQRIAEDVREFIDNALTLSLGLLSSVVTLFSFLFVLWSLSGPMTVPLGSLGSITIPAYLVWLVFLYAILGTTIAMRIGRPLIGLNFMQQRYEADFRYSLVRLRENTESVAFYRGEAREFDIFRNRFGNIVSNFWSIMWRQLKLNSFTIVFGQSSVIFPYLVQAPRFFSKQISLGDLMQTAEAFGQVLDALSFIINAYNDIATWQSVVNRLDSFNDSVEEISSTPQTAGGPAISRGGAGVFVQGLELELPDGTPLVAGVDLDAGPGQALLLSGPTGIGKSTVLRAIAGLWPFGRGTVRLDVGRCFFVPQKPYIPLGTLRQALSYPDDGLRISSERLVAVLRQVGLEHLIESIDSTDNWSQRLSGGEQQRLAFARIFLAEPQVIFLDEATSALDEKSEADFYRMLREAPWRPAVVSVGHRSTLRAFHDRMVDLSPLSRRPATA